MKAPINTSLGTPRLWFVPTWVKDDDPGILYTNERLEGEVMPRITDAAAQTGACLIDLNSVTHDHPEYYADKLHPNATGYGVVANTICQAISADCE